MKRIFLLTVFIFPALIGFSQSWTQGKYTQSQGVIADSFLRIPRIDTLSKGGSKDSIGAILYRLSDSSIYVRQVGQWSRLGLSRDTASLSTRINLAIPLSQKAVANGVATLGLDGRVPATQLPTGSQVYKGTWDASTNTPTLADGTGTAGWTYRVIGDTATRDLGSGNITFAPGDDVIYDGAAWQKVPSSNAVNSVNGKTGTVVIDQDDVGLGNVDNTTDLGKPISTATQTALNAKVGTGITITAGTGLTGGGSLAASRTIAIDPAYASFTNYYTKTNLQTSGQASVHFGNLTNKPTTLSGYGITDAAPSSGSTNYIQNQSSADQVAASRISGTNIALNFNSTANTGNSDIQLHNGSFGNGTQNRRWSIYRTSTEAAGNVGNDFNIARYDNMGSYLSSPFIINRSSGAVTMNGGFSAKYGSSITGTGTGTSALSYLLFNDASGSLRGTVGKVNSTLNDFQVTSPYNIALIPNGVVSTAPPFLLSSADLKLTTSTLQMNGASATISSGSSLSYDVGSGEYHRFKINGSEKVTISQEGILSVGNSSPSSVRASAFQVEGNGWSTDAWILGTGNSPTAEFGLSGSGVNGSAFVRTMGTGDLTFQTSANQVRARVNGTTGYFEVPLTMKAGAVDVNGNAAISGSGVASFSSVTAPAINSTSTLHVAAVYTKTRTMNGNGSINSDDYTINLDSPTGTGGHYTLTLPDPAGQEGRELEFWAGSGLGDWTTNYSIIIIAGPPVNTITGGEKIKAIDGVWKMLYKSNY